jgi:ABC-2 type transport system permease protein
VIVTDWLPAPALDGFHSPAVQHRARSEQPSIALMLYAFGSILRRDLVVARNELLFFLATVVLQPVLFLFLFGVVLPGLGYLPEGYAQQLLFPGLIAMTALITAIQSIALPLVSEFGWTREIEDRLLAPIPTWAVAAEKMIYATLRALVAATVMVVAGTVVLGAVPYRATGLPLLAGVLVLGTLAGAAIGLTMATLIPTDKVNMVFALVFTPLFFTGATQYPWLSLEHVRWFQVVTAANPITYVSEGLRAALVPAVPHIPGWVCLLILAGALVVFGTAGMAGFQRRAIG